MTVPMSEVPKTPIGGFIYVIGFNEGIVKVGRTVNPKDRLSAIKGAARTFGHTYRESWVSPAHLAYKANEATLISAVKAAGGRSDQREYFTGVTFADTVALAEKLEFPPFDLEYEMRKSGPEGRAVRDFLMARAEQNVRRNPDHPLAQFFPEARDEGIATRSQVDASTVLFAADCSSMDFDRGHLHGLKTVQGFLTFLADEPGVFGKSVQLIKQAVDGMTLSAIERVAAHGSLEPPTKAIEGN